LESCREQGTKRECGENLMDQVPGKAGEGGTICRLGAEVNGRGGRCCAAEKGLHFTQLSEKKKKLFD